MGKPLLAPENGALCNGNRRHVETSATSICHERMSGNVPGTGTPPDVHLPPLYI